MIQGWVHVIDIHCHILPSVDDGASSLIESIKMAREAEKQGIKKIIATPHHLNGEFVNTGDHILGIVDYLNGKLQAEQISVEILPGQETRIYGDILDDLKTGDVIPLNRTSNYVLIELPASHVPQYVTQLFFDMLIAGYTPILSNPEQNEEFQANPDKLYRIVKNGALTQIKAGSVVGRVGKKIQTFSHQMLRSNLMHFVASDAHHHKKGNFFMKKAFHDIEKHHGSTYSYRLKENSHSLVTGQQIHRHIPSRIITNKRGLKLFKR